MPFESRFGIGFTVWRQKYEIGIFRGCGFNKVWNKRGNERDTADTRVGFWRGYGAGTVYKLVLRGYDQLVAVAVY